MKRWWCKMVIVFSILGCETDENLTQITYDIIEATHTILETEIVNRINEYRNENGFSLLATDQQTQILAHDHSDYMAVVKEVTHSGFSSRHLELKNKGAVGVGEIVGGGYSTVEAVVIAWLKSEDHNKIIKGNFTHCGVSIKEKYYTVIFIKIE